MPAALAGVRVETFSVVHDGEDCLIAFFRPVQRDNASLEIVSSSQRSWKSAQLALDDRESRRIARIDVEAGVVLIALGDPDAAVSTVALTENLKPLGMIRGMFVRAWPNGFLQYDARQSDFDPAIAIGVFDPETSADRRIFQSDGDIIAPIYFDWQTNTFALAINDEGQKMVTCEGLASIKAINCRQTALMAWQEARPDLNVTQLVRFAASQPRFR